MKVALNRVYFYPDAIQGELLVNGLHQCFTEELPWLDNRPDVSCIPCGTFQIKLEFSQHFQRTMPVLQNVPDRAGIEIHWGDLPENTEGCILVGQQRERLPNGQGITEDALTNSKAAFAALWPKLQAADAGGEDIVITIAGTAPQPSGT